MPTRDPAPGSTAMSIRKVISGRMGIGDRASESLIEAWNTARIPTDHHSLILAEEADRAGEPAQPATIRRARETVRMTLDDELAADKERAGHQGGLYRELLNYPMSPGLHQHVATRIAQLQKINPQISAEPLNDVRLGANNRPGQRQAETTCEQCFMIHAGECP